MPGRVPPVRLQILSFSCSFRQKMCKTGMHSSRVRTTRFSGHLFCTHSPCHTWCHSSPQCGQTDACENITWPQTSIAGGNNRLEQLLWELTPPQGNAGSATDCLRKIRLQLELVCDGMNIAHWSVIRELLFNILISNRKWNLNVKLLTKNTLKFYTNQNKTHQNIFHAANRFVIILLLFFLV